MGAAGAASGVADAISKLMEGKLNDRMITRRQAAEQGNELVKWQQEQGRGLTEFMGAHPDQADSMAEYAKSIGLNLDYAKPSDTELVNPLESSIFGAKDELGIKPLDAYVQQLQALGRPSLTAPAYGQMPPSAPAGPTPPDGIAEDAPLPSTQFGPTQNPNISRLASDIDQQKQRLVAQRGIDTAQKGDDAYQTAYNTKSADAQAASDNIDSTADVAKRTAEAQALGANTPQVGAAKAANEKLLTPVMVDRAGKEEGARTAAEFAVKYDPANVAKEASRQAEIAKATLNTGVLKQRAKAVETAKENSIPLAAQIKQLSGLYQKAIGGDVSAYFAYNDMAQNLRPMIARATGYTGKITNAEMGIAGNMIPGVFKDNLTGNALLKFKTLEGLATYGPKVAASLPPDASIDDYMAAVSRVVNEENAKTSSPIIAPGLPNGISLQPTPALQRLRQR